MEVLVQPDRIDLKEVDRPSRVISDGELVEIPMKALTHSRARVFPVGEEDTGPPDVPTTSLRHAPYGVTSIPRREDAFVQKRTFPVTGDEEDNAPPPVPTKRISLTNKE